MNRKESQLHMRLSDDDRARLDVLIDTLNQRHAVPGRPVTRTDAMRFALARSEAVSGRLDAEALDRLDERFRPERSSGASREHETAPVREGRCFVEHLDRAARQRHAVLAFHLHPFARHRPHGAVKVGLGPGGTADFAGPRRREHHELEPEPQPRRRPRCPDLRDGVGDIGRCASPRGVARAPSSRLLQLIDISGDFLP